MTLTVDQLRTYAKYRGDEDGFARIATPAERSLMADVDWMEVTSLVQSLALASSGQASIEMAKDIRRKINLACADAETVALLEAIANRVDKGEQPKK